MKPTRIAYPFLVSIYPVLTLAAANVDYVTAAGLAFALLAFLAVAALCWFVSGRLTNDRHRRGLFALLGVAFFCFYGFFERSLGSADEVWPGARTALTLGLWVVVCLATAGLFFRLRRPGERTSHYLNVCALIFLAFPLLQLGSGLAATSGEPPGLSVPAAGALRGPRRDIYLIVLDKYTGTRSLAANYAFDNRPFEAWLRDKGFFVPAHPRANYSQTKVALPSMLNWMYMDSLASALGPGDDARAILRGLTEHNLAWRFLHGQGYRFVFFPSAYFLTARNSNADLQLPEPGEPSIGTSVAWLSSTPVPDLLRLGCDLSACGAGDGQWFPYEPESAERMEWKFAQLAALAAHEEPTFVFAHLLLPHEPYQFNADCTRREPFWPLDETGEQSAAVGAAYSAQIACTNQMLARLIDALLSAPGPKPIIILQSDHGHARIVKNAIYSMTNPLAEQPPAVVDERMDVFAAYYLPDNGNRSLYDTITPINVLPIVFNHYFGTRIPKLPDRMFWSDYLDPLRLTHLPGMEE
jgi:hypothetical protein